MKTEMNNEKRILYVGLLEALFSEVPRWKEALRNGPLDGAIEAHERLIDSWLTVRDLAHRLSNHEGHIDGHRATLMMLLEAQATQEVKRLIQFEKMSAAAAAGLPA